MIARLAIRIDLIQDESDAAEVLGQVKSLHSAGYLSRAEYYNLVCRLGVRLGIVS